MIKWSIITAENTTIEMSTFLNQEKPLLCHAQPMVHNVDRLSYLSTCNVNQPESYSSDTVTIVDLKCKKEPLIVRTIFFNIIPCRDINAIINQFQ